MRELIKTSLKLLFRNVGFWLCIIVLPILATYILNIQQENLSYYYVDNSEMGVLEIESLDEKVAYYAADGKFVVKVYDASGSQLADYMLGKLMKTGMFKIGRLKFADMTKEEADERAAYDGENDRMGAALYLSPDFDEAVLKGQADKAITAYVLSEDERFKVFEDKLESLISGAERAAAFVGTSDAIKVVEALKTQDKALPKKQVESISGKENHGLTKDQIDNKTNMGYAFAFLTLSFVLCGNFVAQGVINEQKNDVLTRLSLTGTSNLKYFASKMAVCVIVSAIISGVLAVCTLFIDSDRLGIDRFSITAMVFLLGLIFCILSLLSGALVGNVMSANITCFSTWTLSNLLSGVYFPLTGSTKFIQALSFVMPQKWFIDGTELFYLGDNLLWPMLICVTIAYIVVFLGFGSVGIRMRSAES